MPVQCVITVVCVFMVTVNNSVLLVYLVRGEIMMVITGRMVVLAQVLWCRCVISVCDDDGNQQQRCVFVCRCAFSYPLVRIYGSQLVSRLYSQCDFALFAVTRQISELDP